ncbi:hypothetical protein PAL_GLEAN10016592 [Pteropus alecto]|uniref:Uncharacterized protein n=1 Tax=Pteropus alecto TaxID=9402 RepID=L5L391_PTEAL|nr:hypothetical protein PAL_GLEAN10016592 [Pteropus alecto]
MPAEGKNAQQKQHPQEVPLTFAGKRAGLLAQAAARWTLGKGSCEQGAGRRCFLARGDSRIQKTFPLHRQTSEALPVCGLGPKKTPLTKRDEDEDEDEDDDGGSGGNGSDGGDGSDGLTETRKESPAGEEATEASGLGSPGLLLNCYSFSSLQD